jgi:hypothetical protein
MEINTLGTRSYGKIAKINKVLKAETIQKNSGAFLAVEGWQLCGVKYSSL